MNSVCKFATFMALDLLKKTKYLSITSIFHIMIMPVLPLSEHSLYLSYLACATFYVSGTKSVLRSISF